MTFGSDFRFFIQFATNAATTKVFPHPGGPYIIESRSLKAIVTAAY